MQLAAAACLTGTDLSRIRGLPHTEGWKNEFVISMVDSHTYIHQGIEVCGGKLVRVGTESEVTTDDLLGGIGEDTAAVVHFLGAQSKDQLREVVAAAEEREVPVIVDAAAQLPPRTNLTELVGMGASLAVFSGGKGLRGPQDSGLVLGQGPYVEAVRLNASPYSAIGRGMKVGKEEIMGLVAAVDRFLKGRDEEDRMTWEWQVSCVVKALEGIPGVRATIGREGQSASPDLAPRAYVDLDDDGQVEDVIRTMRDGDPSVVLRRGSGKIVVDPMTLKPGEEEAVAERLREVLST
jgi:L-seryl-tRNA(Ser) seleniumtransferase